MEKKKTTIPCPPQNTHWASYHVIGILFHTSPPIPACTTATNCCTCKPVGQEEDHEVRDRRGDEGVYPLAVEDELHDPHPEARREDVLGRGVGQPGEHRRERVGREQQEHILSKGERG